MGDCRYLSIHSSLIRLRAVSFVARGLTPFNSFFIDTLSWLPFLHLNHITFQFILHWYMNAFTAPTMRSITFQFILHWYGVLLMLLTWLRTLLSIHSSLIHPPLMAEKIALKINFQFILHWYTPLMNSGIFKALTLSIHSSLIPYVRHQLAPYSNSTFNSFFIDTGGGRGGPLKVNGSDFQFILHWYHTKDL